MPKFVAVVDTSMLTGPKLLDWMELSPLGDQLKIAEVIEENVEHWTLEAPSADAAREIVEGIIDGHGVDIRIVDIIAK